MNVRLLLKVGAVFFVSLLLLLPIAQIADLVRERQQLRDQVVADIARSAGYTQTVQGPFLVVPYERTVRTWSEATNDKPRQLVETTAAGELVFLPRDFQLTGGLTLSERARGIYTARVFKLDGEIVGNFLVEPHFGVKEGLADYTFGTPYLTLGVSDIRGITGGLSLTWRGSTLPFEPNTFPPGGRPVLPAVLVSGVHALLPALVDVGEAQTLAFGMALGLQGTGEFRAMPVGRESRVQLDSNWPHPSFVGDFPPTERSITNHGFQASWQSSFFSTNMEAVAEGCHRAGSEHDVCRELGAKVFAVSFVDPVDHYLKSERATKYAFLFVGLTFALFFLFEVQKRFSVHPVQYGLVGLALAVFFLLLLSLSEHIGFAWAYATAACASVSLIFYYVIPILGNVRRAGLFGGTLGSLYAALYGILSSEDYALLTGTVLVFLGLGAVMLFTRRVNWSKFGQLGAETRGDGSVTDQAQTRLAPPAVVEQVLGSQDSNVP